MAKLTIKDLLEAGCHFGHQTRRWNPKMKHFVYGAKNGISIIDLTKTMYQLNDACNFLQKVVVNGGDILFVGTKNQAQQVVKDAAEETGMFYVSERWLGGALTNNVTIRQSIKKMYDIDKTLGSDATKGLKKKELSQMTRRSTRLHKDLDGIAKMRKLPAAMIVVDVCKEETAVREAKKLGIPVVAIVDTNGDPEMVDYPIAANDDAVRSISVIMDLFTGAIKVASEIYQKRVVEEKEAKAAKAKAKADEKAAAKKAAAKKPADKKPAAKKAAAKKPAAKKAAAKKAAAKNPAAKKDEAAKAE
ncbi:30S ribosomal protein S2 [Lentisphaerota bacterium WC36G]|nr:30S ribosomal protein S2 [Lentisphaerae bacterium WC36]